MTRRINDKTLGPAVDPQLLLLPLQSMLMMQTAMVRAWDPWLRFAAHMHEQMCLCQREFFTERPHLRQDNVCSKAADLKDHYGRRTGDVEVERI